jgi:lysozyme
MSKTTRSSARRRAAPAGILGLLALATLAGPVGAWQPVSPEASIRRAEARAGSGLQPVVGIDAPPLEDRDDALAAGGRRAEGGRKRTVMRHGIDVSHWQGYIRWKQVARSGVTFAVAKATEGTWMVDRWYHRNKARAQKAGVLFTAYHFANPSRHRNDAIREADWFLKHADLNGSNLLPALDLEKSGGLSDAELRRWTMQWMRRVHQKLGVRPMLYTSPGFWTGNVGNTTRVARAGFDVLWLSHWETDRPDVPARRWDGNGWTIWQWTESGRVRGVEGWVDRNIYSGPKLRSMTIREIRHGGRPRDDDQGGSGGDSKDQRPRRPAPR